MIVNLLSDEMSIMKHLQFFGNKFVGLVDLIEEEDTSELAAECLTFMTVAVNNSWKIPLGYFLIKGLTVDQRVNLVTDCGVKVISTQETFCGKSAEIPRNLSQEIL